MQNDSGRVTRATMIQTPVESGSIEGLNATNSKDRKDIVKPSLHTHKPDIFSWKLELNVWRKKKLWFTLRK